MLLAWLRWKSALALDFSSRLLSCSSEGIHLFPLPTRMLPATFCSSMVSLSQRIFITDDKQRGLPDLIQQ